jgi:hypothetical protein
MKTKNIICNARLKKGEREIFIELLEGDKPAKVVTEGFKYLAYSIEKPILGNSNDYVFIKREYGKFYKTGCSKEVIYKYLITII